jgi:hypothetical protein
MSVSSPCEICHQADAKDACDRCGQLVCDRHYEKRLGLCVECAADVTGGDDTERIPDEEELPDGVDTYRF